jgi:hypothetical protein
VFFELGKSSQKAQKFLRLAVDALSAPPSVSRGDLL